MTDFKVQVRPARCVVMPDAGLVVAICVVKGEELGQLPHVSAPLPGRYYIVSMHCRGTQMTFGKAQGDYLTQTEAEQACDRQAAELAKRLQDRASQHLALAQLRKDIMQ
jgi:hypothetical protein